VRSAAGLSSTVILTVIGGSAAESNVVEIGTRSGPASDRTKNEACPLDHR
jgi:hypothetical protein